LERNKLAEDGVEVAEVPGFGMFAAILILRQFNFALVFADAAAMGRKVGQADSTRQRQISKPQLPSAMHEAVSGFINASKRRRELLQRQLMLLDTLEVLEERRFS
jgi:hypothetical protein